MLLHTFAVAASPIDDKRAPNTNTNTNTNGNGNALTIAQAAAVAGATGLKPQWSTGS